MKGPNDPNPEAPLTERRDALMQRENFDLDLDRWLRVRMGAGREEFNGFDQQKQQHYRALYIQDARWHWSRILSKGKGWE